MADITSALTSSSVAVNSEYLKITEETKKQTELDKDTFIQLLVTQMKYQDPLNPMDNSEMLAQLAQFTALEQMMNVSNASQKQLASSMIGKYVEYYSTDSSTGASGYQYGKVDYVNLSGDTAKLGIGDVEVALEDVYSVLDGSSIETSSSAFDVIHKTVQAIMTETMLDGSQQQVIIEGEVQSINMKNGTPYVVIGLGSQQLEIAYSDVQNIVENTSITGKEVSATIIDTEGNKIKVSGTAEYIKVSTEGTYVYVDGNFVNFNDIESVK